MSFSGTEMVAGKCISEAGMVCSHWYFYVLAGLATCMDCGHQWHV
jgi:hypothetical protein